MKDSILSRLIKQHKDDFISQFETKKDVFEKCKDDLKQFVISILNKHTVKYHGVTVRIKEEAKVIEKIENKGAKYRTLSDMTDILGIRIITYFEDDVDKIGGIIKPYFNIDIENSVDKRKKKSDSFGYQSLQYIASFTDEIIQLPQYNNYVGIKFEIQIRSILQHAWAEIEHELGYKAKNKLPDEGVRGFARVAAVLELADLEFMRLRGDI